MKVLYYYITRLGCWEVTEVKETWPGNARFNFFSATCADVSEGNCDSEFNLAKGRGSWGECGSRPRAAPGGLAAQATSWTRSTFSAFTRSMSQDVPGKSRTQEL